MLNARGFDARFSYERPDGTKYHTTRPLAYWDDDGEGVVIDDHGQLRGVRHFDNFTGYEDDQVIGVIAAARGTQAVYKSGERLPVIGWIVDTSGYAKALVMGGDGANCDDRYAELEHPDFADATP